MGQNNFKFEKVLNLCMEILNHGYIHNLILKRRVMRIDFTLTDVNTFYKATIIKTV